VRGLKQAMQDLSEQEIMVAPFTGAWIETGLAEVIFF